MVEINTVFKYWLNDVLLLDGDKDMRVKVTAIICRRPGPSQPAEYEVSWLSNGELKTAVVDEWRLSR